VIFLKVVFASLAPFIVDRLHVWIVGVPVAEPSFPRLQRCWQLDNAKGFGL